MFSTFLDIHTNMCEGLVAWLYYGWGKWHAPPVFAELVRKPHQEK